MKPWIGTIVHYVADHNQCKAAIITGKGQPGFEGAANLQVIYDGPIYQDGEPKRLLWKYKVEHNNIRIPKGTWHSIEECPYLMEDEVEDVTLTDITDRVMGRDVK